MKNSILVAIVGIDAAGKTTQIKRLNDYYLHKQIKVKPVFLKDKPTVSNIKSISIEKCGHALDFENGLRGDYHGMAYNCDFFNHYITNIKPFLNNGTELIISDRYTLCYKAYCYAVQASNRFVNTFLDDLIVEPDLEFLLDINFNIVSERIQSRSTPRNEDETDIILQRLIYFYRREYKRKKGIIKIDASQPIDVITDILIFHIEKYRNE